VTRLVRLTVTAAAAAAGVLIAGASPAGAQESCGALPNPIVVVGSTDFEPLLKELAVKLAAEPQPTTIVIVSLGSQAKPCAGIQSVVASTDFGGAPGRYYALVGGTITPKSCSFPAGQTAHIAISEVFYESCAAVPQPKPADIADLLGPVLPIAFVVPKTSSLRYVTYEEARAVFGCGVSSARTVAGVFDDSKWVFCRDPAAGTQIAVARNLGLSNSTFPGCRFYNGDGRLIVDLIPRSGDPAVVGDDHAPTPGTIGFVAVGEIERNREAGNILAFRAQGQTQAFHPHSRPELTDQSNVRDGHYPLWGYTHLVARMTGGSLSPQASELIGWINGTKTSPKVDPFFLEVAAGFIPQCAMKVKRTSDGGLLSRYAPPRACHCAFEAQSAKIIPAGCTPCASASGCTGGLTCQYGFCD
jgi:hypothetical protein